MSFYRKSITHDIDGATAVHESTLLGEKLDAIADMSNSLEELRMSFHCWKIISTPGYQNTHRAPAIKS